MDGGGFVAALQDSASALYHDNINPLLQKCVTYMAQPNTEPSTPSLAMQRALQHSENLKWQQDMFHRLLHLLCLSKEGLASQQQITSCKRQVLTFLESTHPDGEWPEFTRDKLLFLQDLLFASCISESEYHASKKPLILRLADQGAIIDAEDFIFDSSTSSDAKVTRSKSMARMPSTKRTKALSMAESEISGTPTCKTDIDANTKGSSTSPLKHVVGALCRFNRTPSHDRSNKLTDISVKTEKESNLLRVPHALDFLRPENCPIRDAPPPCQSSPHQAYQKITDSSPSHAEQKDALSVIEPAFSVDNFKDMDVCNWFTSPPSSPKPPKINAVDVDEAIDPLLQNTSPAHRSESLVGGTPSRFRNVLTGLIPKKTPQPEAEKSSKMPLSSKKKNAGGEEEKTFSISKSGKWGLDILRFPKKLQFDQEDNPMGNSNKITCDTNQCTDRDIPEGQLLPMEEKRMQSPNTKKLKKQVLSKGTQPDFFIDKVLGENIKNELSRIRADMNKTQPGQTFSNEQIDAIATKLPMNKAELKKFFPQTWCEKYGEIVLDVVQKEFKEHVGEMQKLGKGNKSKQQPSALSPSSGNDENMEVSSPHPHHKQQLPRRTPDFSKCFTTLDENSPAKSATSTTISWGSSPKKQLQSGSTFGSPKSPIVEKSRCKLSLQHRYSRKLTPAEDNLDRKLEEEIMKMPLRRTNDYGAHLRA